MKKIIISTILVSVSLLSGCSKGQNKEPVYTVTKEQYDQLCYYEPYLPNLLSLNFTITYKETLNGNTNQFVTKYDNGKIMATHGEEYGDFYVSYKEGTYNTEDKTWSYDYYYQEDGQWKVISIENESMPDDVYLPHVGYMASYEEMRFNEETNCYEQIAEDKVLNSYYHYYEIKVKFINGNIDYISWKYKSDSSPDKEYLNILEVTDYGSTKVTLPALG